MSSNNNQQSNEYLSSVIAQLLLQQANGVNAAPASTVLPQNNNNALQNLHQQQLLLANSGQLNVLLTSLIQQQGGNLAAIPSGQPHAAAPFAQPSGQPHAAAPFAQQIQQPHAAAPFAQQIQQPQVANTGMQPQQAAPLNPAILGSLKRLAALNPSLVVAALTGAVQPGQQGVVEAGLGQNYQQQQQQIQDISLLSSNLQQQSQSLQPDSNAKLAPPRGVNIGGNDTAAVSPGITQKQDIPTSLPPSNGTGVANAVASGLTAAQNLKHMTLEQLEAYAKQLDESSQPIPRPIAILLSNARRKQDRHNAKKLANRKSAESSRARKKEKLDAMVRDNMKLKRESIILNFIPDAVITMSLDGVITFANKQLERLLQHKVEDITNSNIEMYIEPDSQKKLRKMIKDLVEAEELLENEAEESGSGSDRNGSGSSSSGNNGQMNGSSSSEPISSDPNVVSMRSSDQSSPTDLEFKVHQGESISDSSDFDKKHKSSSGTESSKEEVDRPTKMAKFDVDDVLGESVTANNAGAKLSSLHYHKGEARNDIELKQTQHQPQPCLRHKHKLTSRTSFSFTDKQQDQSSSVDSSLRKAKYQSLNSSDSGYREESNDSPESNESSSSTMSNTSDEAAQKGVQRIPPLAPSCNIQCIRRDRSTVWCELAASIRTRSVFDGDVDTSKLGTADLRKSEPEMQEAESKELLLCFRPIQEGNKYLHEMPCERSWNKKKVKIVIPHNHKI